MCCCGHCVGDRCVAVGGRFVAVGGRCVAVGGHCVAVGGHCVAVGDHCVAVAAGGRCVAVAVGGRCVAVGGHCVAVGGHCIAVAVGDHCIAVDVGGHCVAVGGRCVAVAVDGLQVKLEEQTKKIEDLEEALHGAQTEIKRLEMEVDSAVREKVGSATTTTAVDNRTVMEGHSLAAADHTERSSDRPQRT